MPAGTAYNDSANSQAFWRLIKRNNNYRQNVRFDPQGVFAFDSGDQTVAVTTLETNGDELFTLKFPDGCYLVALQVETTELDGAANTMLLDFIVEDSAGTETVLINASTIGQAGGFDELDPDLGYTLLDVSNQYLGFKVQATSVNAQAGTVRYKGLVYVGDPITNF